MSNSSKFSLKEFVIAHQRNIEEGGDLPEACAGVGITERMYRSRFNKTNRLLSNAGYEALQPIWGENWGWRRDLDSLEELGLISASSDMDKAELDKTAFRGLGLVRAETVANREAYNSGKMEALLETGSALVGSTSHALPVRFSESREQFLAQFSLENNSVNELFIKKQGRVGELTTDEFYAFLNKFHQKKSEEKACFPSMPVV